MFLTVLWSVAFALAADANLGKPVYVANCTACHGVAGDGKGAAAVALNPKPTDFTAAAYWEGKTDEQVAAATKAGRPGTSMTGFAQLSEADLLNVAAYLRTLKK